MEWIMIGVGVALLAMAVVLYIVYGRNQEPLCPEPWPDPPEPYHRRTVPLCGEESRQAKAVMDPSGLSIPTDYDPEQDGEFEGPPGMLSAVAALRLGGVVLMAKQDDGSWLIQGPGGIEGRGDTASRAYGDLLNRMKQEMN